MVGNQEQDQQDNIQETMDNTSSAEHTSEKSQGTDVNVSPQDNVKLEQELAEQKDKFIRLYSEFENYKRRTAKEKLEFAGSANKDLMIALLPIIDDMQRAEKSLETSTDLEAIKEGLKLVFNKFSKTLESKGLKSIDAQGQPFDSEFHEAITQIPAPSEDLKGKVVDVVEKGYFLNDKIIRFAKVVIGA
ncbi:MAG TPA: nucleotide exchange factor GrpE [Cytophagales bacterium]|nr:nucleotide exchange factor GrpE [Cytophagales bacterium]